MTSISIDLGDFEIGNLGALLSELRKMSGDIKVFIELTKNAKRETVGETVIMPPSSTAAKSNKQDIKRGPTARARGAGRELLLKAIAEGVNARADLIPALAESGMTMKSVQGAIEKATQDKLVTSNGRGIYALTKKGIKAVAQPHVKETLI
jgi:hypothetical protein